MLKLIKAVQVVDSLQRKPELYKTQSFFGELDLWDYVPYFDKKLCPACRAHAHTEVFRGTHLRAKWPYLEIQDENTILPKEHPNCRCQLWRIILPKRYLKVLEKLKA